MLFTENGCTDILATPDGGLIKTLDGEFRRILDLHVSENFDSWYSADSLDAAQRRKVMLDAYSRAWVWFGKNHGELPYKVGLRTVYIFPLR